LYRLLRRQGTWPHASTRRIAARAASPVDAALLGVQPGAPLLAVDARMSDTTGTMIEVSEQLHVGAHHSLELHVVEH
jgi:DNA-binding GntR family transcriptional regulator